MKKYPVEAQELTETYKGQFGESPCEELGAVLNKIAEISERSYTEGYNHGYSAGRKEQEATA